MSNVDSMKLLLLVFVLKCTFSHGMVAKNKDEVVLVAPVLAPPKDSRARGVDTETAKDFPLLMVLSNGNKALEDEAQAIILPQPVYVQKLEDQKTQKARRKRQFAVIY